MNIVKCQEIDDVLSLYKNDETILKKNIENFILNKEKNNEIIFLLSKLGYMKNNKIDVPIINKSEHKK